MAWLKVRGGTPTEAPGGDANLATGCPLYICFRLFMIISNAKQHRQSDQPYCTVTKHVYALTAPPPPSSQSLGQWGGAGRASKLRNETYMSNFTWKTTNTVTTLRMWPPAGPSGMYRIHTGQRSNVHKVNRSQSRPDCVRNSCSSWPSSHHCKFYCESSAREVNNCAKQCSKLHVHGWELLQLQSQHQVSHAPGKPAATAATAHSHCHGCSYHLACRTPGG
jgi:hypothetical protein